MGYQLYVVPPIGSSKIDATVSAPVGTETIAASVPVGSVGIVLEDTVAVNKNFVINALDALRDLHMETTK